MAEFEKGTPQLGLRFKNADESWAFWVAYGGCRGFDVRKRYANVSKYDGKVTSCRFVCCKEGHRRKGQTNNVTKCFRAETRTDCKAQMSIMLDRGADNYEVSDVVLEHNHLLHLPETRHLMATQRKISEVQALEIEAADDSGIRPKDAHELASRQVLDLMNIKTLPDHYILKRWSREARNGRIQDKQGRNVVENPKLEAQLRTKNLFHKFLNLAYKAADYLDCCLLLEDGLDCLSTQLEDKLNLSTNVQPNVQPNDQENVQPNVQPNHQQRDELLAAQLKKKEVSSKNSRRKKTWIDKLPKGNRKLPTKSAVPKKKEPKKRKQDGVQPSKEVENDGSNKEAIMDMEEYNVIGNFTQLVTAPICDDDILHVDDLF